MWYVQSCYWFERHVIMCCTNGETDLTAGKTDRVDIQSFYPFLALLAQACHMHPDIIPHPALTHKILNSPNPGNGNPPVKLPNGICAKLLLLGEEFLMQSAAGLREWWPTGTSDQVRNKLMRRIGAEGSLMPICLSICIALVSEMYTTTALPAEETPKWQVTDRRRVRLCYNGSPIADFGIAQGSVRVTPGDRLAYWNMDKDQFLMGQDPNDHYRIYFKTLSGDEYYLDVGMFTFNLCFIVNAKPYRKLGFPNINFVPAHFHGKEFDRTGIDALLFKPRKRHSILRDSRIHDFVCSTEIKDYQGRDQPTIFAIMDEIAGRKCTDWEKDDTMMFLANVVHLMRIDMEHREYVNFPKFPHVVIDADPDEVDDVVDEWEGESEEMAKYMTKWTRKLKKGKISRERWEAGFQTWAKKPHEARMKMENP